MSLLPGQILPPSTPLGRVNDDGTVVIDTNWWLLLYNLCNQVIGTQGGLPVSALLPIESTDFDVATADIPTLVRQIANLSIQLPEDQVVPALADVVNALTLAVNAYEAQVPIGSLPATNGGTGQTQYAVGDLLYSGSANNLSRLTGNITTTKKFLTQTGSGSASAAPGWNTIAASDLPGSFAGFANPSAKVGPTAVNGSAATAMSSDSAPAIDLTATYPWTGTHTYSNAITVNGGGSSFKGGVSITVPSAGTALTVTGINNARTADFTDGTETLSLQSDSSHNMLAGVVGAHALELFTNNSIRVIIASGGAVTVNGNLSCNGVTPPAQITGWGTATGATVVANFPGATATLAQCSGVIAKLITDLKAFGLYGA